MIKRALLKELLSAIAAKNTDTTYGSGKTTANVSGV